MAMINALGPEQNSPHFVYFYILNYIFLEEKL